MSKKRKGTKKKSGKRRRSVGGLNMNKPAVKLIALGVGVFIGDKTNKLTSGVFDKIIKPGTSAPAADGTVTQDRTVQMVAEIGLGGLLLMNKKGSKTVQAVTTIGGALLAGAGIRMALTKFGVIKGYQSVPVIGKHRLAGYQEVPVIGLTPPQLAGTPGQLQGYRVNGGLQDGYASQGSGVMGSTIKPNANGSGIMSGTGYLG